jgi:CBS domain-containing protein
MKQLGELKVNDYMTKQTIVVDDTAKLTDAIRMMDDNQISVVPVVDDQGDLVGILSNRDLTGMLHEIQADLGALNHVNDETRDFLTQLLAEQGDNTRVLDVMTAPVETVIEGVNLVVAAQKLNERTYHHLPVVDSTGQSVGIISTSDFVRAIAEHGAIAAG